MKLLKIPEISQGKDIKFGTSGLRGLVCDMTPEICYSYATAFLLVSALRAREVVIGYDLRPSSPAIARACCKAAQDQGKKVTFVGPLATPAVASYALQRGAAAMVITGSHIPFDRNGIKFYGLEGEISKQDEQLIKYAQVWGQDEYEIEDFPVLDEGAWRCFVDRYVTFFGENALSGKRVVLYEHSSVARDLLREILEKLGCEVISKGRTDIFIPLDTEAVSEEDSARAAAWAKEDDIDAILSTDGDGDRPLIGDENGQWIKGDIAGLLCSKILGLKKIALPVSCNSSVEQSGFFSEVTRTRVGSPYVLKAMAADSESDMASGFEANGGFLLGSDVTGCGKKLKALPTRDAILPMVALLLESKVTGKTLSELVSEVSYRHTASDRLQDVNLIRSRQLINELLQRPASVYALVPDIGFVKAIDTSDGLRFIFSNRDVVHIRPSGNAPELRCYTESESPSKAVALCRKTLQRISELLSGTGLEPAGFRNNVVVA